MKQVKVKIVLDLEAEVDERGRVDEDTLKEAVYQYLEELIEDDSLDFKVESADGEEEDEDY